MTRQNIALYNSFFNKLENKLSKILIYPFQKERIDAYIKNRPLKKHFEYTFFTDRESKKSTAS
mgnify:CR=1 FL=1